MVNNLTANVLTPECREFPATLIVFAHQVRTNQVRFDDFGDRSGRKSDPRSDHVESARSINQNGEVLLLDWAAANVIETFEVARLKQVVEND